MEDRKRASFAQHQHNDSQTAAACLTIYETYEGLSPGMKLSIFETEEQTDKTFWTNYLVRLGVASENIEALSVHSMKMKQGLDQAHEDNLNQIAPQLKMRFEHCRQTEQMLAVNRCANENVGDAPPATLIPAVAMPIAKICREMAAIETRNEPADWVLGNPEELAEFIARIEKHRREVAHFDALLASQPIPQCPTDYKGGACLIGCTGGSNAYGEAYDAVEKAIKEFRAATGRNADWSNEAMIARNKLDRVQWEGECDDLKMVTNYTE